MLVRPMTAADAAFAASLTARTPEASAWSAADYANLLGSHGPAAGFGLVAEAAAATDGQARPVGFLVARVVADEAEILNVAVEPDARRRGVGAELIESAIQHARSCGAGRIFLEVRAGNASALRLYARQGFREIARRARYYQQPMEDAIVLERRTR